MPATLLCLIWPRVRPRPLKTLPSSLSLCLAARTPDRNILTRLCVYMRLSARLVPRHWSSWLPLLAALYTWARALRKRLATDSSRPCERRAKGPCRTDGPIRRFRAWSTVLTVRELRGKISIPSFTGGELCLLSLMDILFVDFSDSDLYEESYEPLAAKLA